MITRTGLADEIDAIEASIKALNESKSEAYKAYRAQLEATGMEPRRASAEVAATKAAIAKRRKLRENPDAVAEKDDLIDVILVEITERPSRAREAVDPKLVETIASAVQTDIGRTALISAVDVMIEREEAGESDLGNSDPHDQPAPKFVPAFLLKAAKPLRPYCQNPELCASGTRDHCHTCKKAAGLQEAAA